MYTPDKDLDLITRPDGQSVDFVYDGPGKKLSSIITPTGTYGYGYHATKGLLETLAAPGGQSLAFGYDGFLLTSETSSGTVNGTVGWGYNNEFRVNSQSINGSSLSFGYDNDGLLTSAGSETLVRFANNGLIDTTTLGNVTTAHTYNTFGEPATDTAQYSGNSVYSASYPVRDKLGRIKQRTEVVQGVSHTFDYTYTTAGQLDTVTKDGVLVADYGYDSNGNRTTLNGATVGSYDGQDRLLSYDGATYTYTPNGELLTKTVGGDVTTYGYDVLGNLRSVALPGNVSIEYVVDGRNRRVGKKVNGVLVQGLLYGDQLEPIAELDGAGNLVSRFVYGDKANVPDYMVRAGVTYRIVSDYLGSPRLVINALDGTVVQRMDFDEFGNVTHELNPGFQPFGFAGGLYDQHTKLTRFGARDYEAQSGRWSTKDPIRFAAGDTNIFGYVAGDPVNLIDANGLRPGDRYITRDAAGVSAVKDINATSIAQGREYAGRVYQNADGSYSYTSPRPGTKDSSSPGPWPAGTTNAGDYHTHGANDPGYDNESFSPDDMKLNDKERVPGYLGTPSGAIKRYDPDPFRNQQGPVTVLKKKGAWCQ